MATNQSCNLDDDMTSDCLGSIRLDDAMWLFHNDRLRALASSEVQTEALADVIARSNV